MKKLLIVLMFLPLFLQAQTGDDELVNPKMLIHDIKIDLRYASADHKFLSTPDGDIQLPKLYTANECLTTLSAVKRLKAAQDTLRNIRQHNGKEYPEGIGIKIWDAYRPRAVQYVFWEIYPNPSYVADPRSGSMHNRGGAIDLTLVDLATGEELQMPTEFDDFSVRASHGYDDLPEDVIANRKLLLDIMVRLAGFESYSAEWWHYNVPEANSYPLMDFQMK